jgi:hypothetical protein
MDKGAYDFGLKMNILVWVMDMFRLLVAAFQFCECKVYADHLQCMAT